MKFFCGFRISAPIPRFQTPSVEADVCCTFAVLDVIMFFKGVEGGGLAALLLKSHKADVSSDQV